jgi:3-methyladenine DNA glycosylase/8-oxoguanine DNA glycosylase
VRCWLRCAVAGVTPRCGVARLIAQVRHRMPGLRLGATLRVWDVLVPAVLEQKVTGVEARRSWRELCWRFGARAAGSG